MIMRRAVQKSEGRLNQAVQRWRCSGYKPNKSSFPQFHPVLPCHRAVVNLRFEAVLAGISPRSRQETRISEGFSRYSDRRPEVSHFAYLSIEPNRSEVTTYLQGWGLTQPYRFRGP